MRKFGSLSAWMVCCWLVGPSCFAGIITGGGAPAVLLEDSLMVNLVIVSGSAEPIEINGRIFEPKHFDLHSRQVLLRAQDNGEEIILNYTHQEQDHLVGQ